MRRDIFLLLLLMLTACVAEPATDSPSIEVTRLLRPSLTITPSFMPATPTIPPATTSLSSATPINSPPVTEILTETVTEKPISYLHVFPLQPAEAGGFAEGTNSHGYPATDIFAVVGTQFVAVTDGVVDFVSFEDLWDPDHDDPALRGGLSVAIIGDDGVRYYGSHLSAVAVGVTPGVRVKAGQVLGLVGNSGDASNTTSHLHFGISRPTTPNDWKTRRGQVDPFPFLQAWRDGLNVTPPLPAETPTPTPNLIPHVFPVQPAEMAGFSEGGHTYPATDIFAQSGAQFVAATNGTVDEVSTIDRWNPATNDNSLAGGLSVRIIGDDGLHYYGAHLSAISSDIHPGMWVPAGKLLGWIGNTGDARNTMPHVHFEISISAPPFTKVDPFLYLTYWLNGQNITPVLPNP
jgi:murein DD-endopeptidase MepM/ murein hydrolase activator NlpD